MSFIRNCVRQWACNSASLPKDKNLFGSKFYQTALDLVSQRRNVAGMIQ
jgi:hypothetical protein